MAGLTLLPDILRVSDPSQADAATLAEVRKYDPNATYVQAGGEQSSEGGFSPTYYQLSFDPSKLPASAFSGGQSIGAGYSTTSDPSNRGEEWQGPTYERLNEQNRNYVIDPSKLANDPNYGEISPFGNMTRPVTHSWLDYSPLLVAAFAGAVGGPAAFGFGSGDTAATAGTGAMDMTGSAGTGIPGSFGANAPLGSADSSLFGVDALTNPASALGGGSAPVDDYSWLMNGGLDGNPTTGGLTQAQWDEIIAQQPENSSFIGPNGTDPNGFTPQDYRDLEGFNAGLDSPSLLDRLGQLGGKLPGALQGLLPKPAGGAGGGGGLLGGGSSAASRPGSYEDATAILRRFYDARPRGLLGGQ